MMKSLVAVVFLFGTLLLAESSLNYNDLGFYRVGIVSPKIELGFPEKNAEIALAEIQQAAQQNASVILFPELSMTGYSVEDLFHSEDFIARTKKSIRWLAEKTAHIPSTIIIGAPYRNSDGRMYNVAFVLSQGKIIAAVPKTHLPNYNEFYERRWFQSGEKVHAMVNDAVLGRFTLSTNQLFKIKDMIFAIEICEDLFAPISPSAHHSLKGANAIFNLSASDELVGKAKYRKMLVLINASKLNVAYVYASSGPTESTKDLVFGNHILVSEDGSLSFENERFQLDGTRAIVDLDIERLLHNRMKNITAGAQHESQIYTEYDLTSATQTELPQLTKKFAKTPFVPEDKNELNDVSSEVLQIQATGLARRIQSSKSQSIVLGVSGGLDSTLSLLVALEAAKILKWRPEQIIGVTMPGFGTTSGTKNAAQDLMSITGITQLEIPIRAAVTQHFSDIKHDPNITDAVYENSQARERTQILFDLANKYNGLVLGTGNLSELCLGWCTFNGDHMSSYNVNASVPKTLVRFLVGWYAKTKANAKLRKNLSHILATVVSPELLPPSSTGEIAQKTEDVIGPYKLHDFFIYHYLRNGFSPKKIYQIAVLTFHDEFKPKEIAKWLTLFLKRFATSQFKRTTLPSGPKVGTVSVSPRGDFRFLDELTPEAFMGDWVDPMSCKAYFQ